MPQEAWELLVSQRRLSVLVRSRFSVRGVLAYESVRRGLVGRSGPFLVMLCFRRSVAQSSRAGNIIRATFLTEHMETAIPHAPTHHEAGTLSAPKMSNSVAEVLVSGPRMPGQ